MKLTKAKMLAEGTKSLIKSMNTPTPYGMVFGPPRKRKRGWY